MKQRPSAAFWASAARVSVRQVWSCAASGSGRSELAKKDHAWSRGEGEGEGRGGGEGGCVLRLARLVDVVVIRAEWPCAYRCCRRRAIGSPHGVAKVVVRHERSRKHILRVGDRASACIESACRKPIARCRLLTTQRRY